MSRLGLRRTCMGKAMLDPKRDLAGATPETLARALARPLLARRRAKAVVRRDEVSVEKSVADHSGNRVEHLVKGS